MNELPSIHIKLSVLLRHSVCPQRRNRWHPKGQGKESGSNVRNRLQASALLPVRMKKRTKFPAMMILWSAVIPLSEENQTEHDSQDASKKKPKKKPSVNLSDEHEEMVEWIKDHPLLFSKGLDYKDTARKKRLWEEKAKIGQA